MVSFAGEGVSVAFSEIKFNGLIVGMWTIERLMLEIWRSVSYRV